MLHYYLVKFSGSLAMGEKFKIGLREQFLFKARNCFQKFKSIQFPAIVHKL